MKKYRGFGALLLAVPLTTAGLSLFAERKETASANSAPPYWSGADGMGAILAGDQCPVEVEKEHLTFSVSEFPKQPMENMEELARYSGKFTAEYTFRNPTEEPVALTLVFPLGTLPEYFPYDAEIDRKALGYSIEADGSNVPYTLRHTLDDTWFDHTFDLEKELKRLYPAESGFYRDDLPVTAYTYRIEASGGGIDGFNFSNFVLTFGASAERTRVFCSDECSYGVKDGKAKLIYNFPCGEPQTLTVYVLGEGITDPETYVFRYEKSGIVVDEAATVSLENTETAALSDLLLSFKGNEGISEADWNHAFIDGIERERYPKTCFSGFTPQELEFPDALMQWFEYSLTVPAGGTTVNRVTAPIYPTMDGGHSQELYRYTYLLSPAQKWSKFGELTVDIDTPFYLSESSLNFTQREGGYTLTRSGLPLGELTFTLSEEERQISNGNWSYTGDDGNDALVTAIVIMSIVVAGAAAVIIVLAVQSKRKKKRREEEEKRLLQARPQEGKIDLPDDEPK